MDGTPDWEEAGVSVVGRRPPAVVGNGIVRAGVGGGCGVLV